ncbi:MAG: glucokinase, partial [Candidatus Binatia bacterium]
DYPGLEPIIEEFRRDNAQQPGVACFGVAGPVIEGKVKTPNLPWVIEQKSLARVLGAGRVELLNDLESAAYGTLALAEKDFFTLNEGIKRDRGHLALIAAGTGLGESTIWWDGSRYRVLASEGGHGDFAPRTDTEIALLRYLTDRLGHVSYERVISGPGLINVYQFLKDSRRYEEPSWLSARMAGDDDDSAVISAAALAGEAEICVQALNIFASAYGAEAGNLALRAKALGGVFVGGGIAPKILPKLQDGSFMAAFTDKGRYRDFAANIPVKVVLNPEAALLGAASYAAAQIGS